MLGQHGGGDYGVGVQRGWSTRDELCPLATTEQDGAALLVERGVVLLRGIESLRVIRDRA